MTPFARSIALAAVAALVPLGLLILLLAAPDADRRWESQPAHFWLVLAAALLSLGLGYAVSVAARRRRDARLFVISLAFMASAGFLGLHALATPTVLLGANAGFELATPVGLVVAGALAAVSALELGVARSELGGRPARPRCLGCPRGVGTPERRGRRSARAPGLATLSRGCQQRRGAGRRRWR